MKDDGKKEKILIFNMNWLGDVIFTSPFIRAIRKASKMSVISCVVPPRCEPLLKYNPHIDNLIIYDDKGREAGLIGKFAFISRLRKEHFDVAYILHRSFTRALLVFAAGAVKRIGYNTKARGFLLTEPIALPGGEIHRVEYYLKLAESQGTDISNKDYDFFWGREDEERSEKSLRDAGIGPKERFVVFNPGGNWEPKRWPVDNFAELADLIMETYKTRIVVTGAAGDRKLAEAISERTKGPVSSLCGKTGIRELGPIFKRSSVVISGDSGPMHIAVSVGANVIAIFGPTKASITGPYGRGNYSVLTGDAGCRVPCYDTGCRDNRCMKLVTAGDVIGIIEKKGILERAE